MTASKVRITKAMVDRATATDPRGELVARDRDVPGLELWCYPSSSRTGSARKSWKLYFRASDRSRRRPILGDATAMLPEDARKLARELLGDVARGADPSTERTARRTAPTVDELCDRYLEQARATKKKNTVAMDELMVREWIRPRWGKRKVASIGPRDAEQLHTALRDVPIRANRVRSLVSHMFAMAERWGWHPGPNPTRHVERYPERTVHRPLSEIELARLGKVLSEWPDEPCRATRVYRGERTGETVIRPHTAQELAERQRLVDIIRLLILTGCRRNEIVTLTWPELDLDNSLLKLADSKSGARVVWLPEAAVAILRRQERAGLTPYVFPGRRAGKPVQGIQRAWERIRAAAELADVRLHDLRHNAGAAAAAQGLGQAQIARLLGHRQTRTAERYSEPHRDPAARAAELVGGTLAAALGIETSPPAAGTRTARRVKP
jgi:integrase